MNKESFYGTRLGMHTLTLGMWIFQGGTTGVWIGGGMLGGPLMAFLAELQGLVHGCLITGKQLGQEMGYAGLSMHS